VKPTICSLALTFLVWGSQLSVTAPDGWLPRATLTGEPATLVAVAEVVVDDGVELEPHAATHAAATAATAMNRTEVNLCLLVFKIVLPDPGWRLALTAGPDEGVADGMGSPAFGSPIRGLQHVQGEAIPAENR
jgi:hypothetical protein